DVPHALRLMDHIFGLINALKDRESAMALNKQKKENYSWIATVLSEMLVAVPDVRGMPILTAMARARAAGMKLVVEVERPMRGSPPGTVLEQRPSPGTTDLPDNELRVTLSGRTVPVA
ncbi:MAG: PASTA domain-containing protein, partial [Ktedonobacterales bacterium]